MYSGSIQFENTSNVRCLRTYGNITSYTKLMLDVVPSISSKMPRPENPTALDLHHRLNRNRLHVSRPQAHRRILLVHAALDIMRRPAALILKEANAANRLVLAQIEPVLRPVRHINQIARFNLNREHRPVLRMNVKHATSADREPHFVLG